MSFKNRNVKEMIKKSTASSFWDAIVKNVVFSRAL